MNQLLSAMEDVVNVTTTENGAGAFHSTKSSVLDFFALGSSLRNRSERDQVDLFAAAWDENPELALKAMFYARDVRGGQGQRCAFRNQLKYLAGIDPDTVRENLTLIPEYGRWDDMYQLVNTKLEGDAFNMMRTQFMDDYGNTKNPSILAKWLKSENASSMQTIALGKRTRKAFKMKSDVYRKMLSNLRSRLNVVEHSISAGDWDDIQYSKVPSLAMMKYRKAFAKHDQFGFQNFIDSVNKGETTMNASALYPYEIIEKIGVFNSRSTIDPQLAQAMWSNLTDYTDGNTESAIAVVDTSGSMSGTPINVAVSLGMYFAERAQGPFKDHFITFSDRPTLQKIAGNDIVSKVRKIGQANWGMTTNLEAVFDLILKSAIKDDIPQSEMVNKLYIISDMQFNSISGGTDSTLFEYMRDKYNVAGYELPQVVFWNVDARNNNQPVTMDERGTQLVSGFSPSTFAYMMGSALKTPYELMLDVLGSVRYEALKVA